MPPKKPQKVQLGIIYLDAKGTPLMSTTACFDYTATISDIEQKSWELRPKTDWAFIRVHFYPINIGKE